MAEFPHFRSSVAWRVEANDLRSSSSSRDQLTPEMSIYCAYNETRQRFLSANIESAAFSATKFCARLLDLTARSDAGLWIVPVQNISSTNVRVPLDLIYLDRNFVVLSVVESFPLSQGAALIGLATSILVLPAQSIGSTGTKPGDRLTLCAPGEMKLRLQPMSDLNAGTQAEQRPASSQNSDEGNDQLPQKAVGNLIPFVDRSDPTTISGIASTAPGSPVDVPIARAPSDIAPVVTAPAVPLAAPRPIQASAPRWKTPPPKSWLKRLLSTEPSDPRKASRTALSWLVAYFFTGGRPIAHAIRDISVTGMYVFTEERWYPGTVVRMTLTDKRDQTTERSFTINAEVVRSAVDGVGFQFVLKDAMNPRPAFTSDLDCQAQGACRAEVEAFLRRISSDAHEWPVAE